MNGDARVVNYSGLVRGATQRLVKLELSYHPNDELIARLEEYLYGLAGHENSYNIVYMTYGPFQESVSGLILIWDELKTSIYKYRAGLTSGEALLEISERHFQKADEATHNAEYGSEGKLSNTELLISAGMAVITIIVIIVAISMYLLRRSERRQMEILQEKNQQLESAILKANEASRAKSIFLSNMSHDIRTPLNGIIGMTAIASGNLTNPQRMRDCLRKIERSSRHLQSLVNDVLDMSKIESGKFFLNTAEIVMPEFTQGLINIIGQQVKTKNQELNVSALSVVHENILGDQLRLNQLFINILSNSVKFTPAGGIIGLTIKELPCKREGFARFEFTCCDTGIGMGEAYLQRIFDSFSREKDSRIDKIEGSGLGLSITKRIVDMMAGSIQVESEKNKGTKFTVTLEFPISKQDVVPKTLRGIRVLITDSDEAVCADVENELESIGVSAAAKCNGADALALIREGEQFDAVIVDWKMPDMSGYELCQRIRQESGDKLPVIISSVYERVEIEQEALAAGITGFIQKPLYTSALFSTIREVLFPETDKSDASTVRTGLRLDGVRILMAEDNELNTEIAVEILTAAGIEVDCASNGKEAVEMFETSEPSAYAIILMDMQMPVMTGCEAAAAIRNLPRADAAAIPIIALTANAFEEDIREALAAGMNAHVSKPINFETLKTVMSTFLPVTAGKNAAAVKTEPAPAKPDSLLEAIAPYGVNISAGLARFAGKKEMYEKFLLKFPKDTIFETLSHAIQSEDFDAALKAAHALKGIAANLSMDTFAETAFQLEQALKQEDVNQALVLFQQVRDINEGLTEVISRFIK
jgi:signal transduction histidine kinase/CheY-like chemotaxis protein